MNEYAKYLAHHGVKGQKWGVRRYQNKDGSLTDAGKRKKAKELDKEIKNAQASRARAKGDMVNYGVDVQTNLNKSMKYAQKYNSLSEKLQNSRKGQKLMSKGEKFAAKAAKDQALMKKSYDDFEALDKKVKQLASKIENDSDVLSYQTRAFTGASHDRAVSGVDHDRTRVRANTAKQRKKNLNRRTTSREDELIKYNYYYY